MLRSIAWCALLGVVSLATSVARADRVPNPAYEGWKPFKVGSWVKHSQETKADGATTTMTTITTLVELTATKAVVETRTELMAGGERTVLEPVRQEHASAIQDPSGPAVDPEGAILSKPKEGAESLRVGDKTYACKTSEYTFRLDDETIRNKAWTSEKVPGGLVKSESRMAAPGRTSLTTVTLVAFEAKP